MTEASAEAMPEWARPADSFPYFAIGIMGSGIGWVALNGTQALFPRLDLGPFLGWVGLLVFSLAYAVLLGLAVYFVRRRMQKPDRFGADTALALLGGGFMGAVLIGLIFAAMALF